MTCSALSPVFSHDWTQAGRWKFQAAGTRPSMAEHRRTSTHHVQSHADNNRQPNPRMVTIEQVVPVIDVVDVALIGVGPIR